MLAFLKIAALQLFLLIDLLVPLRASTSTYSSRRTPKKVEATIFLLPKVATNNVPYILSSGITGNIAHSGRQRFQFRCRRFHATSTAFVSAPNLCRIYDHKDQICSPKISHCFIRERMSTKAAMKTEATKGEFVIHPPDNLNVSDRVSSLLQNSINEVVESLYEDYDVSKIVHQTIHILHNLTQKANSFCLGQSTNGAPDQNDSNACETKVVVNQSKSSEREDGTSESPPLQLLASAAISSVKSLEHLVQFVNQPRKRSKPSTGRAWKALESVVRSTFEADLTDERENTAEALESREIARALASLAVGIALSLDSTDISTTKMIASAILPSDQMQAYQHGVKYQKQEVSKKMTSDDSNSESAVKTQTTIHSIARAAVLGLLRLAVDESNQSAEGEENEQSKKQSCVDLQIVSKLESGFSVGELGRILNKDKDKELAKSVANVVNCVFVRSATSGDEVDDYWNGDEGDIISKDIAAPTFSLVSNTRPWDYVKAEKLVRCAAEMNLWYSAELLCDAAVASTTKDEKRAMMATSFPKGKPTESLLADGLVRSLPQDSIAHLAAGAIIDITFDYRLYRRADVFASKYYSFGGPERFAEARFLHACDTITKVVKKRQVQIIDKQIERVDAMVARVSKDLNLTSSIPIDGNGQRQFHGEDIAIETMSEKIREFTLRRLRVSNMHAAAARFANLWGVAYEHDPVQMAQELEERRLLYLQWNDEGCPGKNAETDSKDPLPLPDLISEPAELLRHFRTLEKDDEMAIGFDCEWHDSIRGVALLQLSTITESLLLDIPALTATKEGCDALRATVGKLFSRMAFKRDLIGFGCKDDIKRLRASPCISGTHWFPQNNEKCTYKDLRTLIADMNPQLGAKGMLHFGLSRACEVYLGKQLDKSEQCSDWLARPLSVEQREYAALDAWSCAAIATKILSTKQETVAK